MRNLDATRFNIQSNWHPKAAGSTLIHTHSQGEDHKQAMIEVVLSSSSLVFSDTPKVDHTLGKMWQGHVCYSMG